MDTDPTRHAAGAAPSRHPSTGAGLARGPRWRPSSVSILAAVLAVGTALLYAQVSDHPFIHFDDNRYLTENEVVQRGLSWSGVAWAFSTFRASNWHPLTWLSHMLDVQLFGMDAGAHHLVNVALHAANAALLLLVLFRMTGALGRSAAVAALFAVHPLHVESVAWVAERKDVLSTLFGLLALLAYGRYAERPRARTYLAVVAAFAASLLAKPMWVTFPFLLLLLDFWPLGRWRGAGDPARDDRPPRPQASSRRLVAEKLPLLALSVVSSAITVAAQRRGGALQGLELGVAARFANSAVSYVRYMGKTIWPSSLAVFYPHPGDGVPAWEAIGAGVALTAVTLLALWRARRWPWFVVGWCWFLGTMVPVIGLVQVGAQAMADRYTYLPSIGLFIVASWGVEHVLAGRLRTALGASTIAVVLVLAAATSRQLGYWSSHEALFRHALAVTPDNGIAHGVLSEDLRAQGRFDEALAHAREAVRLAPGTPNHWNNLAISLRDVGLRAEAREALLQALQIDPAHASSWLNLAMVDQEMGDLSGAEAAALRATALMPKDGAPLFRLGLIREREGRAGEAEAAYQETVRRSPGHFGAWTNLAVLYQSSGRVAEAEAAFEAAVRVEPGNRMGWRNLGVFLVNAGRHAEALRALDEALRLGPGNPDVMRRIGLEQAALGARADALATAAQLDALDPAAAADIRARLGQ